MSFNREDLISWSELAPSLQETFKTLQSQLTTNANNLNSLKSQFDSYILNTGSSLNNIDSIIGSIREDMEEKYSDIDYDLQTLDLAFETHGSDMDAHKNIWSQFPIYQSNKTYKEGEFVFVPEFPSNYVLECTASGTSSSIRPDFSIVANMTDD